MQNTDFRQPENSKMKKFFLLLVMLLLLLIPIGFWYGIIDDRESYRNDAVKSVASSWGDVQVFGSPQMSFDRKKDKEIETVQLQLNNYKAFVNISTETRQKGIYKIPVYTADVKLTGDFLNTYGDLSDKDLTTGLIAAKELKSNAPGQTYIDMDGTVKTDVGEPIDVIEKEELKKQNINNQIIDLKAKRG